MIQSGIKFMKLSNIYLVVNLLTSGPHIALLFDIVASRASHWVPPVSYFEIKLPVWCSETSLTWRSSVQPRRAAALATLTNSVLPLEEKKPLQLWCPARLPSEEKKGKASSKLSMTSSKQEESQQTSINQKRDLFSILMKFYYIFQTL